MNTAVPQATVSGDASVHESAVLGPGTRVWNLVQIRESAVIGASCVIGRNVYVDHGVVVGDGCKIQNGAQLFAPAKLGAGVFVGPGAMLTNDIYPRAITPQGDVKGVDDWEPVGVTVDRGASIGAGAIVIGGITIGEWSVVAAGAVVTHDVAAHALVAGVPARRIGWVGRDGRPMTLDGEHWVDGSTSYRVVGDRLEAVERGAG